MRNRILSLWVVIFSSLPLTSSIASAKCSDRYMFETSTSRVTVNAFKRDFPILNKVYRSYGVEVKVEEKECKRRWYWPVCRRKDEDVNGVSLRADFFLETVYGDLKRFKSESISCNGGKTCRKTERDFFVSTKGFTKFSPSSDPALPNPSPGEIDYNDPEKMKGVVAVVKGYGRITTVCRGKFPKDQIGGVRVAPGPRQASSPSRCSAKNVRICADAGGVCEPAFSRSSQRIDLCRWRPVTSRAGCKATAGIWTQKSSSFAKTWPSSVPTTRGSCITQMPNIGGDRF